MQSPRELTHLATALGGVPILGCSKGSPAAKAGLLYGDIILSGDGTAVGSWSELLRVCARASSTLLLRVQRAGSLLQLPLPVPSSLTPRGILGDAVPPPPAARAHGDSTPLIADLC